MGILLLCWFWAYSAKFRIWGHVQHVSWYQDQRHFQHPTRQCGRVPWILFWPNSHVIQCYACIFVFLGGTFWLSKRVHWPATVPPGPASAERIAAMSIPIGRPRDSLVCCLKIWEGKTLKQHEMDSGIPMFPTSSNRNCIWGGSYIWRPHHCRCHAASKRHYISQMSVIWTTFSLSPPGCSIRISHQSW